MAIAAGDLREVRDRHDAVCVSWLTTCPATGWQREGARYLGLVAARVRGGASVRIDLRQETHHGNA